MDYRFCPRCNGLIEASGESHCVCNDDDYGDYLYHQARDEEAEREYKILIKYKE